jgi:hypothetical protein
MFPFFGLHSLEKEMNAYEITSLSPSVCVSIYLYVNPL